MRLSDVVILNKKIARSVNLERDNSDTEVINDYKITGKAQEVIERLVAAMGEEKVSAWSLVGPYGMGKSAFLNFLLSLTGHEESSLTQTSLQKLEAVNNDLYYRFIKCRKQNLAKETSFIQIPIVAAFEPINVTLARGLFKAIAQSKLVNKDTLSAWTEKLMHTDPIDATELLKIFKAVTQSVQAPLLLIVDELGKNLEYLSYHSHNGDLFILQQLAEMDRVYLFVCLHQSFNEYLSGFSIVQQQEWNKVQGRFEEISFIESTPQMLNMIQSIIKLKSDKGLNSRVQNWARKIEAALEHTDLVGKEYLDVATISSVYPLHPLTGLVLIELCRRYAQNERTLVSFLSSGHIYALPAQLERIMLKKKDLPAIGLDSLYNYFFQLSNGSLAQRPSFQRWVEIHDILNAASQLSEEETLLLKNIGVLNLLEGTMGIKADLGIVSSVMGYSYGWELEKLQARLDSLIQRGVLFYRKYTREFRLWEGSDFDVNGAISKEKSKLSLGSLEDMLEYNLSLSPIVAARHSLKKGIVRKFERRWIDAEFIPAQLTTRQGFDGLMLYCFGTGKELVPPINCNDQRPLIIAFAPVKDTLKEIGLELVACQRVLESYPQLVQDRVARKEIKFRLRTARERFREYLLKVFTPGASGLIWYAEGEEIAISNRKELSMKISDLCDRSYPYAPRILNEIVSGEKLSSAAVRARRELVEAMATKADMKNLGFDGWGPEVAMYRSLILTNNLHKKNPETGCWYLSLESNEFELNNLWKRLDKLIDDYDSQGCTVEIILNHLRECPFGLKQGPALIYISLYLLVKADTLTIFREGIYNPYFTAADMALLLKRPELFSVKRFMSTESQEKVFAVYRKVINMSQLKVDSNLRNATMLGVIGPLMKFIDQLPRYSKHTRQISRNAQRVRAAITNAVDPLKFLFEDLPVALGIDQKSEESNLWNQKLEINLRSVINELGQAYEQLNKKVQEALLEKFSCSNLGLLYSTQRETARDLITICDSKDLKPLLQAISRDAADDLTSWVKGIAGAVVKKPLDVWQDDDLDIFITRLADYSDRIKQLEALAAVDQPSNALVITVMGPGGKIKRDVISNIDFKDEKVSRVVEDFQRLPENKRRAVMAYLANNTLLGG